MAGLFADRRYLESIRPPRPCTPMTDVLLSQTNDGGEIQFVAGQVVMTDGLDVGVYLSFGGNEDDSGGDDTVAQEWWGNKGETDAAKRYRSELQFLLRSIPAIPANLRRLEDAATRDLAWMLESLADDVTVFVKMPALNTVNIAITVTIDDKAFNFAFSSAWRARIQ